MNLKDYKSYFNKIGLSKDSRDRIKKNLSLANGETQRTKRANACYKASLVVACLFVTLCFGGYALLHNLAQSDQVVDPIVDPISINSPAESPGDGIVYNPFGAPNILSSPHVLLGDLIYMEIASAKDSTEYFNAGQLFTGEVISREHIGKEIGTVIDTEFPELREAKIYEYTPVQGQRIVVIQKDDQCSLFIFVSLRNEAMCQMEDVFGVYGIASAQDVKSIKISEQVDEKDETSLGVITDKIKISEFLKKIEPSYKNQGNNVKLFSDDFYKFTLELNDEFLLDIDFSPDIKQIRACSVQMELTSEIFEYLLGVAHD